MTVNEAGRRGGLIGGKARAKVLSRKRRVAIATKASHARWKKSPLRGSPAKEGP